MTAMAHTPDPTPRWALAGLLALAPLLIAPRAAVADSKLKRGAKPYVFELFKVELVPDIPVKLRAPVEKRVLEAIDQHAQLVSKLDADAPDPEKDPAKFESYLARRGQKAFKVNLEVTSYSHKIEPASADSPRRLSVSIAVRMFGETLPQRVMAFTGDGASTMKIDIGAKLRPRDSEYANDEAIKAAVADAIAMSVQKLKEGPTTAKKKKKRRKS
jgi:hypothetical protein